MLAPAILGTLPSTRAIETRSLPSSLAATHRGFAFYVALPKSSIPPNRYLFYRGNPFSRLRREIGIGKTQNMKLTSWFVVCFPGAVLATTVYTVAAEEPTASPRSSVNNAEADDTTREVQFPSPNGKFAFLIGRGEYERTIDLIDKKTTRVLQHIDDTDMGSVSYRVLWAPDSKRFALMTRAGHPNQDVRVYSRKGDKFQEIKLPELTADIPEKVLAGKEHPHVAMNDWQEAEKWNKDGSLRLTIENMVDGAGHTADATRTVLLGFDKSDKPRILKSTVKYESRSDDEE